MRQIFIIIGLLIVLLLPSVSLSCAAGSNIKAVLGEEFTLPAGKTANIDSEGLSLNFVEVISDSRCAKGVECVWAGEAKCRMLIKIMGSPAEIIITQAGGDTAADYFVQYKINFKLEPYPEAGKTIAPSDYKLIMTVTK
jgi:hypothetical protein